jgi:hypothetical protein
VLQLDPVLVFSSTAIKAVHVPEHCRLEQPVLAYGTDYNIEPDHTGPITLSTRGDEQGARPLAVEVG